MSVALYMITLKGLRQPDVHFFSLLLLEERKKQATLVLLAGFQPEAAVYD